MPRVIPRIIARQEKDTAHFIHSSAEDKGENTESPRSTTPPPPPPNIVPLKEMKYEVINSETRAVCMWMETLEIGDKLRVTVRDIACSYAYTVPKVCAVESF